MKSTLLKTLAAASLVATTHAAVHVMGVSWKERGVNAPEGTILPNPGTVQATRGYLIMDDTITSATPNAVTYIEYKEVRNVGVVSRVYTVDTDFAAFLADSVSGDSGGHRLYGHMRVPLTIAQVTNPMIPFSGTTFDDDLPRKISFDQTVFQNGVSDTVTGPRIVVDTVAAHSKTLRSVMSGSANPVNTTKTTISEAANELVDRLKKQGFERRVVEAPKIVTDLTTPVQLVDGETKTLKVILSPDSIPEAGGSDTTAAPTYQWFKDGTAIPTGVGETYTVTGGASSATNGSGTYKVVVTNVFGSVTSGDSVVSAKSPAFSTDLAATASVTGAGATTLGVVLNPTPVPVTYQWLKSPTGAAGSFVNVDTTVGGKSAKLTVIGGEALTGGGFYRLDVTTTAGTVSSAVCNVTVVAAGTNFVFTTNLPRTRAIAIDATATLTVALNAAAGTPAGTLQWYKAPLNNPTAFAPIADATAPTLTISGNAANEKGPGIYRVVATTTSVTPVQTATTLDCTVTTAP